MPLQKNKRKNNKKAKKIELCGTHLLNGWILHKKMQSQHEAAQERKKMI